MQSLPRDRRAVPIFVTDVHKRQGSCPCSGRGHTDSTANTTALGRLSCSCKPECLLLCKCQRPGYPSARDDLSSVSGYTFQLWIETLDRGSYTLSDQQLHKPKALEQKGTVWSTNSWRYYTKHSSRIVRTQQFLRVSEELNNLHASLQKQWSLWRNACWHY